MRKYIEFKSGNFWVNLCRKIKVWKDKNRAIEFFTEKASSQKLKTYIATLSLTKMFATNRIIFLALTGIIKI